MHRASRYTERSLTKYKRSVLNKLMLKHHHSHSRVRRHFQARFANALRLALSKEESEC